MTLAGLQLGHYRLVRLIGSGAMSEVYLAEDTRIAGRQVAVKTIRYETTPYPAAEATREAERLFQREMQVISKLDHPGILPLFDFGDEKIQGTTCTYMVIPYRAEGSLADWLRKQSGALSSSADVCRLVNQAAEALQYAHDQQLVHQDVKPSNFLIRQHPEHPERMDLLLADFGIAKITTATSISSQSVRGTPFYMPPEQWEGHPVPASDQYALAIMTYQLLTGQLPFRGSPAQIMQQQYNAIPIAPSKLNPRLSPALDAVLLRALAKKAEDRFPSIAAFAQALQQALSYQGALRATLAVRRAEAASGTNRMLTLPGKRQIMVYIPPETQQGQEIYLNGEGETYYEGGPRGPLILTISFATTEEIAQINKSENPGEIPPPPPPEKHSQPGPISLSGTQGNQWSIPPALPPVPQLASAQPRRPAALVVLLVIMGVLLILGGGSWFVYANQIAPNQQHTAATTQSQTATAIQQATVAHEPGNLTATAQVGATATIVTGNPDPYPPGTSKLTLIDPLNRPYLWQNYTYNDLKCQFINNSLHVIESKQFVNGCAPSAPIYANFTFEVQMTMLQGYCGGIAFRSDDNLKNIYYYEICTNGRYFLGAYQNTKLSKRLISGKTSPAIHLGLNQANTLAIVANKSQIDLYINGQKIDGTTDTTFTEGRFFLVIDNSGDQSEAAFSNMRLWTP